MTRVIMTAPLREHFALPFIYLQLATITVYLRSDEKSWKHVSFLQLIVIVYQSIKTSLQRLSANGATFWRYFFSYLPTPSVCITF